MRELINSIGRFEKIVIGGILFLLLLGGYLSHVDRHLFEGYYVREDGPIEWLQFEALILAAVVCFKRFFELRKTKPNLFLFCLIALGLIFIFGAGEEISWGQRILGVKSPEFFIQHNSQEETNFHNLIVGGKKINKIIFGVGLGLSVAFYMLLLPYLYRKYEKIKKLSDQFAIPIPKLVYILLYLVLVIVVEITASAKRGELIEFGGVWLFFLMTYFPANRQLYEK